MFMFKQCTIQIDYPNRGLNRRVIVVEVIASNLENC